MKKYFVFAAAVIALAACSSEEENVQTWNGEIRLSYVDVIQTRAGQEIQPKAFDSGESLDVFINEHTTGTPSITYTQPLIYTTGNNGALTEPSTQYFPQNGNGVDIYGVYPSGTADDVNAESIPFYVQNDQSTTAGYKASDLMVGEPKDGNPVAKTANSVQLNFLHCLSKININISTGDGVDVNDLVGATVTIYTNTNDAIFNIQDALEQDEKVTAVESQGQAAGSTVIAGTLTASGNNDFEGLSAIIIPQDIPAGSLFIAVTATVGQTTTTYRYSLPTIVNVVSFESGKVYTYNLKVKKSGLTLDNTTITDWDDGGSVDGEAIQN